VQTASITPDFSQGTIEVSSSPSDMAIQGDGFFILDGSQGERLYSRNGQFKLNSQNELVSSGGYRLMGYGVDENYDLQSTQLAPLKIPLGGAAAAQATQNVYLSGNLTPTGDMATTAQVIDSGVLGNGAVPRPDVNGPSGPMEVSVAARPDASGTTSSSEAGGSTFIGGEEFEYVFTYVDGQGNETLRSQPPLAIAVGTDGDNIRLNNLPLSPLEDGNPEFENVNVYRRQAGIPSSDPGAVFRLVGSTSQGAASFVDNGIVGGEQLDEASLNGIYSYVVTFSGNGVQESRPSELLGPLNLVDGRVHLENLPDIPTGEGIPAYDSINIYRNLSTSPDQYFLVTSLSPGGEYIDYHADSEIASNRELDLDGPKITDATLMKDVLKRNGLEYQSMFQVGQLLYSGKKGGNNLQEKALDITDQTTVGEFLQFLSAASGIQPSSTPDDPNAVPPSENRIPGESGVLPSGVRVTADGRIRLVSNNGAGNAVEINSSAFQLVSPDGANLAPNLEFDRVQEAVGQSASSDFIVYDSLGVPLNVRLTTVLESRDGNTATYRWFADSGDNDPAGPDHRIALGTGVISFDGEGKLISADSPTVTVDRRDIPSNDPLVFELDFSQVSGLATENSEIAALRQDGSASGTLTGYSIGEDGSIRGVFSNGTARTLGQVRLARFANPGGLEQRGQNMFAAGFNSGLPVEGNPNEVGIGGILSGALELSNADIGENLIRLVLASTQYRANSRVISTSQQLLDELMNIRR
jgi:flagellar hook protein FlgE